MILSKILESKRSEVASAKRGVDEGRLRETPGYAQERRGFARALRDCAGRAIIAELKRASPSKGLIRKDFRPADHARDYERAGAVCLSVLTDGPFFDGSLEHLTAARRSCRLPVLRKDFIIDPYQIVEARSGGADAVLLIVAALDRPHLEMLLACTRDEGLDALVEVHDEREAKTALLVGAELVGINNRDLASFSVSLDVTRRLMPLIPPGVAVISESGIESSDAMGELEALGVRGFLVGEHLMRAAEPGEALRRLLAG